MTSAADPVTAQMERLISEGSPDRESGWPEGRPETEEAVTAQVAALTMALAQEEARQTQLQQRSFIQKARAYFKDDWPKVWASNRRDKGFWAGMIGGFLFFVLCGASITGGKGGSIGSIGMGAMGGAVFFVVWMAMALYVVITRDWVDQTKKKALQARLMALEAWHPSTTEMRVWRSVPQVHAQVAALMTSAIGLRHGDRVVIDAALKEALTQDQPEATQQAFIQDAPSFDDEVSAALIHPRT